MLALAELLGESPEIVAVREQLDRLLRRQTEARRLPPILIQGETGTGKGLLARAIHRSGPRRDQPFVDVNCAAIPETLLEAEMFGFERGAFTDARQAKAGLLQAAHRGTIFLDEVGLLPEPLQAKLLKVVRRLGSTRSEPVDVSILSATSQDLTAAAPARRFREDLYHRLAVLTVRLPPLRERGQDILRLAEGFLARVCADYRLPPKELDPEARAALLAYPWPGNVRELANVMERVALLSEAGTITAGALGLREVSPGVPREAPPGDLSVPLQDEVASVEQRRVRDALQRMNWNISRAADLLGISRNKLRYRIRKHGLGPEAPRGTPRKKRVRATEATPPAPVSSTAPAPPSLRWERRRLTLLRADLVPPGEGRPLADSTRPLEIFVEKLQGFGGRVEELSSRGIVAAFGIEPVEDAPRRAALSAMAILKAMEAEGHVSGGVQVKIGIDVAQLMVGRIGPAVQLEAEGKRRAWGILDTLLASGEADGIAVSTAAAPFLERRFDLMPAGALEGAPVKAYRLMGRERTALGLRGRITRFVGRNAELEYLRHRLAAAMTGQGQAVGIVGEPGIGKSRLLHEFRQSLADRDVTYLEGRCFSYSTAIPYVPVVELLRNNFRLSDADTPETIINKVRRSLGQIGMEPDEGAPYLLHLLGIREGTDPLSVLNPEAIKARTFEILSEMTLRGSRFRPLILTFEDVHWIDTVSETYLVSLLENMTGAPVLLLMTYRPGYRPPGAEKSYATQMALHPLSQEDSRTVVHAVLQTEQVPDPLSQLILARAEGNPFFLEELARVVGEHGHHPPQAVPETLQEVLLARIDRLPEDAKRLLQMASVLGREFSLRLLRAIWDPDPAPDPQLRDLTRLEFLFLRSAIAEPVYVFKHALTQEVAYDSLPLSQRQSLHAAAGRALETLHADRLEQVYDRLAYHYSRTDETGKAIDYLMRFAVKAARASAHVEAVSALDEALAHASRLPDGPGRERRRLELILQQIPSITALGRFQQVLELLLKERERVEQLGDPVVAGPWYFWLARTYGVMGNAAGAVESVQHALEEATRCDDKATMGKAYYALAYENYWSGQPQTGVEHGRQAVSLLEGSEEHSWLGFAHWIVAANYSQLGEFEAALEAVARARSIGELTGDRRLLCTAAWNSGGIYAMQGEVEAGIEACQHALESSPDPVNRALAQGFLGGCHLEHGDAARAMPLLEESVRQLGQFQVRQTQSWFLALVGEAYLLMGDVARAAEFAGQGLRIGQDARYSFGVGWAYRALGKIARARGELEEAQNHLKEALRIFESVQARYHAGRTLLDLADLAHARRDENRAAAHLDAARRLFAELKIPKYVERAEDYARQFGIHLVP